MRVWAQMSYLLKILILTKFISNMFLSSFLYLFLNIIHLDLLKWFYEKASAKKNVAYVNKVIPEEIIILYFCIGF